MYRGYKFRLILTKEQEEYCWKAANIARFVYNWSIDIRKKAYAEQKISLNYYKMCYLFVRLKKLEKYNWMNEVASNVINGALFDCETAYKRMYYGCSKYPRYKSKKHCKPSFRVNTSITYKNGKEIARKTGEKGNQHIKFLRDNTVKIECLGCVSLADKAKEYNLWYLTENNISIYSGRITFDGEHWNLSFTVDIPQQKKQLTDEIIGIDVGIKNTAICSNGIIYKNINKTSKNIKTLEKRKRRLKKQLKRKYEMNKKVDEYTGESIYVKTNNINKFEGKIKRINRKLSNTRRTYNHQISREIVNRNPRMIVMENLDINGMMKNYRMRNALRNQCLAQLKIFVKYKAESQGTMFVQVPRNFKSTQLCSKCGAVHKMSLSQRTYSCSICGHKEDRDMNAAHNLENYGKNLLRAYKRSTNEWVLVLMREIEVSGLLKNK